MKTMTRKERVTLVLRIVNMAYMPTERCNQRVAATFESYSLKQSATMKRFENSALQELSLSTGQQDSRTPKPQRVETNPNAIRKALNMRTLHVHVHRYV